MNPQQYEETVQEENNSTKRNSSTDGLSVSGSNIGQKRLKIARSRDNIENNSLSEI